MKKIYTILLLLPMLLGAVSCNRDLPTYTGPSRIYFRWAKPNAPSTESSERIIYFGYDNPMKDSIIAQIRVQVMGQLSDEDRPITAELIAPESSAELGKHIFILPSVVPANKDTGSLYIKIMNTDKGGIRDLLRQVTLRARIRLTPNDHFQTDFNQSAGYWYATGLEVTIYFDAKADAPNLWRFATQPPSLQSMFGAWSKKKMDLICDIFGFTREFFEFDSQGLQGDALTTLANTELRKKIPTELGYGMAGIVNRYLVAQKAAGNTVMDEDGKEMTIGMATYY